MDIQVAPDAALAAQLAADVIARRLRSAARRRGTASIAVSGGATPVPMFDALAELDVPWPLVHVFQVDERVAPDGDPARNASQLVDHLLSRVPIRSRHVHLMPVTAARLAAGVARYATAVERCSPLDVVHLGLGDDGHTASWPPGDRVIEATAAVALTGEFRGWRRMTLTPPTVNGARSRLVFATGASKADMIERWLLHDPALPIDRVRRTGTVVVLDAAASRPERWGTSPWSVH